MNEKKKYKEYIKEFYRGNKFYFVLGIMVAAVGSCIQAYLARLCQQYLDIANALSSSAGTILPSIEPSSRRIWVSRRVSIP